MSKKKIVQPYTIEVTHEELVAESDRQYAEAKKIFGTIIDSGAFDPNTGNIDHKKLLEYMEKK